jgi:hypothetical protein
MFVRTSERTCLPKSPPVTLESFGLKFVQGNNVYINTSPETKEEADRIYFYLKQQ